eukprot:evm.model.scf_964EXC.4 EVM.evm.TU.scf_964EXC.4   scf_964EXC:19106-20506(-)
MAQDVIAQHQDAATRCHPIAFPSPRGRPDLRRPSASRRLPRLPAPRAFAAGAVEDLANDVNELTRHIEAEVVLESGLHVPGAAAGGCYERFGLPNEVAPPLLDPLQGSGGGPTGPEPDDDAVELAVCLATPSDEEGRGQMREAVARALEDMERQGEIRDEIQNILNTMEELEMGSERGRGDLSEPLRPTRRANSSGDAVELDADTVEGYERTVEGNIVEMRVNTLRRRLVDAD